MSQNRKLSVPADNPQYFSLTPVMADQDHAARLTAGDLGDLEPAMTTEVVESLRNIEKLAEKKSSTKSKSRGRLGSFFSLFSSGQRRGSSSGVENEYIPSPAGQAYGSLPSTPTKTCNNNNLFRLSTDSSKTLNRAALLATPVSPAKTEEEPRSYYNIESRASSLTGGRTPVKHSKPPPGPGRLLTPQKTRSFSAGNTLQRSGPRWSEEGRQEWPGLEAPALPVLHRTCRGFPARDRPRRVILYSGACSASRRWRDYLAKVLDEGQGGEGLSIRGQRLEEFGEMSGPGTVEEGKRCEEVVYHAGSIHYHSQSNYFHSLQTSSSSSSHQSLCPGLRKPRL